MTEFTQAELAEAMSKLLDGRWKIRAKEVDTEIDIVTYYELIEGAETLATTYDRLEVVLERGMKRNRAENPGGRVAEQTKASREKIREWLTSKPSMGWVEEFRDTLDACDALEARIRLLESREFWKGVGANLDTLDERLAATLGSEEPIPGDAHLPPVSPEVKAELLRRINED